MDSWSIRWQNQFNQTSFMWQYQLKLFAFDVFLLLQVVIDLHTGMTLALSWISNLKTAYTFWKISSSFLIAQESGFTTKQVKRSTSWHQMEAHPRDVTSEERYQTNCISSEWYSILWSSTQTSLVSPSSSRWTLAGFELWRSTYALKHTYKE